MLTFQHSGQEFAFSQLRFFWSVKVFLWKKLLPPLLILKEDSLRRFKRPRQPWRPFTAHDLHRGFPSRWGWVWFLEQQFEKKKTVNCSTLPSLPKPHSPPPRCRRRNRGPTHPPSCPRACCTAQVRAGGRDGVGVQKLQAFLPQVRGSAFDLEPPSLRKVEKIGLLVFGSFASPCTHNLPLGLLTPRHSAVVGQPPSHPSGSCWCPAWHFLSGARFSESAPSRSSCHCGLLPQTCWGYGGEATINLQCWVGFGIPKRLLRFTDA